MGVASLRVHASCGLSRGVQMCSGQTDLPAESASRKAMTCTMISRGLDDRGPSRRVCSVPPVVEAVHANRSVGVSLVTRVTGVSVPSMLSIRAAPVRAIPFPADILRQMSPEETGFGLSCARVKLLKTYAALSSAHKIGWVVSARSEMDASCCVCSSCESVGMAGSSRGVRRGGEELDGCSRRPFLHPGRHFLPRGWGEDIGRRRQGWRSWKQVRTPPVRRPRSHGLHRRSRGCGSSQPTKLMIITE